MFINFSASNDANGLRNRLFSENINDRCLAGYNLTGRARSNMSIGELVSAISTTIIIPHCLTNTSKPIIYNSNLYSYKIWIYGFISVTVINTCAILGILFIPMRKKKLYKVVMTFMIALAVGSLSGSALLILIPDALQLMELQDSAIGAHVNYKYKATVVFGGVYMFFLLERFLKWIISKQITRYTRDKTLSQGSINISRTPKPRLDEMNNDHQPMVSVMGGETKTIANNHCLNIHGDDDLVKDIDNNNCHYYCSVTAVKDFKKSPISSVAWMIIFGDAVHNFIDGLSIGAAFSRNLMTGISLSIAVLCEELPHELGDFAILLNAGMSIKQALLWNMMSAATCYLGFIIGFILGETTSGSTWIFAIAGGMFLYISLVDMMPELNAILENKECTEIMEFGVTKTFLVQNIGLLIGYSLLLVMSLYGDRIKIN